MGFLKDIDGDSLGTSYANSAIEERLDRAMGNGIWLDLFLKNGMAPISEHSPMILQTLIQTHQQRINKRWLRESEAGNLSMLDKLTTLSTSLSDWSKRLSHELLHEKRKLENLMELLHDNTDNHSISRIIDAKRKLADINFIEGGNSLETES